MIASKFTRLAATIAVIAAVTCLGAGSGRGRDFAPWSEYAKNFRAELDRQWREPVDLYEASLAIARSQTTRPEGPFIDYLRALFGNHWPDLILAIGAPAVNFFQQHRPQVVL